MGMTITVRGLDDELHRQLREQARRHHRSMEAEARDLLARGIETSSVEVNWPATRIQLDDADDWIDRARGLLADAWADEDWDDDWLPERTDTPSRPTVELGG